MQHIHNAIRKHPASKGKAPNPDGIFLEMSQKAKTISQASLVEFASRVPDLCEDRDCLLSEVELAAAFKRVNASGSGEVHRRTQMASDIM